MSHRSGLLRTIPYTTASAVLTFLLVALTGQTAMAHLGSKASWRRESADRRYVLVMVSPLPADEEARDPSDNGDEIRRIRAVYTQSGLYRNDGSKTPLWTITFFSEPPKVDIAPDGQHFVIGGYDSLFVSFYSNGNRLAWHDDNELVPAMLLKRILTGRFPSYQSSHFDAQQMTYTLMSNQGEEFVFDVTTGKLIRVRSPWPLIFGLLLAGIVSVVCFVAVYALRRTGHRAKKDRV